MVTSLAQEASGQVPTAATLPGEAGNTPFDGLPVQGKVLRLWKGGREVR